MPGGKQMRIKIVYIGNTPHIYFDEKDDIMFTALFRKPILHISKQYFADPEGGDQNGTSDGGTNVDDQGGDGQKKAELHTVDKLLLLYFPSRVRLCRTSCRHRSRYVLYAERDLRRRNYSEAPDSSR